jgi:hypothetical protein
MKYISIIALFVSALIHLLPVSGVTGAAALRRLYAIEVVDANTSILLRHRALLFGLLGVVMLVAIGVPSIRVPVMAAALFSAASFIVVAMWVGGYNAALSRVIAADAVVSALLAAGLVTEVFNDRIALT